MTVMARDIDQREISGLRIIIAIPALNEFHHIRNVVKTLIGQCSKYDARIVIADGGSTDGTIEEIGILSREHDNVIHLQNKAKLQSAGVNLVSQSFPDADILIRCDAHSSYPNDFIPKLVATLRSTGASSVVVPMDSVGDSCFSRAVGWVSNARIGTGGSAHRGGAKVGYVDHGHHAAFQMKSFLSAGGYNETFSHNEDAEFDCRLRKADGKIYLDGTNRIRYHPRKTIAKLAKQYFNYGKGRARTVRLHPESIRLRQMALPIHFVATTISLLSLLFLPIWLGLAWPVLYLIAISIGTIALVMEHRSLCAALAIFIAPAMHFSWAAGFIIQSLSEIIDKSGSRK